jgi:hypothetical protein
VRVCVCVCVCVGGWVGAGGGRSTSSRCTTLLHLPWPPHQVVQLVAPVLFWYVPALQGRHSE